MPSGQPSRSCGKLRRTPVDISVVLPALNEQENLRTLLPRLEAVLKWQGLTYELLIVDGNSNDGTVGVAMSLGARVIPERQRGCAGALITGIDAARGNYILTMDADLSHDPDFIVRLWRARSLGDIVIASRYVRGGAACSGWSRDKLSLFRNFAMRHLLSMPIADLSSGFRLYKRKALRTLEFESHNFEIQEEILVKAYARGLRAVEVPFVCLPRGSWRSPVRRFRFGWDIARWIKMRKLRRSSQSADYVRHEPSVCAPAYRHLAVKKTAVQPGPGD
jgi:dolichol-phosphate mannosyltransferase